MQAPLDLILWELKIKFLILNSLLSLLILSTSTISIVGLREFLMNLALILLILRLIVQQRQLPQQRKKMIMRVEVIIKTALWSNANIFQHIFFF